MPYIFFSNKAVLFYLFIYLFKDTFYFFYYFKNILFIFGSVGSSLLHDGLSLVVVSRGYSSLQCTGFSLRWLLLLWSTGSRCVGFSSCSTWAQQLRHAGSRACGLSSCGSRAQLLRSMWDLPGPGIEPMSPALAGGFLTTAPPRESLSSAFLFLITFQKHRVLSFSGKLKIWFLRALI